MIGFYGEGVSDPCLGFFFSLRGCPTQEEKLSSSCSGTRGVLHPTRVKFSGATFPCLHCPPTTEMMDRFGERVGKKSAKQNAIVCNPQWDARLLPHLSMRARR